MGEIGVFDAAVLGRAWLAVAVASAKDPERPVLDRAVAVEVYRTGVRLVATDSYVLARTFIPGTGFALEDEPALDELPGRTIVARDLHQRGASLMRHLLAITKDEDAPPVEVSLSDVEEGITESGTLSGMAQAALVLDVPEHEQLLLGLIEAEYPSWRQLVAPIPGGAGGVSTVALGHELLTRVSKIGKLCGDHPIRFDFDNPLRPVRWEVVGARPGMFGVIMPERITDADQV